MVVAADVFTCISHIRRQHLFRGKDCFFYGSFHMVIAPCSTMGQMDEVAI